jgi:hypothetical protein
MQRVFLPTFSKIGELVKAQIKSVEAVEKRGIQVGISFIHSDSRSFSSLEVSVRIAFSQIISKVVSAQASLSNHRVQGLIQNLVNVG